jgi:integral membrane protein (TIGR01906 family)
VSRAALAWSFGVSLLVSGVLDGALYWTVDRAYFDDFARAHGLHEQRFNLCRAGGECARLSTDVDTLLAVDDQIREGVLTGDRSRFEARISNRAFLTEEEISHLEDVAAVFAVVKPVAIVTTLLALLLLLLALRDDPAAARTAGLVAAGVVLAVGIGAAVAFDPLFLLFHQVFFPQGNFLFDPTRHNLVLLYPEAYWLGVTLRVGATFVFMAVTVAALASAERRRRQPAR